MQKSIIPVMLLYKLIENNDKYSKTSGSLRKYYRNGPKHYIADSKSVKFNVKISGSNHAAVNTKDVEIAVTLKYLSNF